MARAAKQLGRPHAAREICEEAVRRLVKRGESVAK
jgi:hypothetical protein